MSQQYNTNSYVVNPEDHEPPECPPEAEFTLMLMGIKEVGLGKPFKEGDEPRVQFTLEFKIDAENPDPNSLQGEWQHFDLIGWYSPILHYGPNLPDFSGQRYTEPNMYKLVTALNGGTPLPLPTEIDPATGKTRFASYDAAALLRPFFGRRFRSVIGPSKSGWPRLQGNPMPMLQATAGRRRGVQRPAEAVPERELAGVAAGLPEPEELGEDFLDEGDL